MLEFWLQNATRENILKTLATNTVSPLLLTQQIYNNELLEKGALIANISSTMGSKDWMTEEHSYATSYSISKAALNMVSKIESVQLKDTSPFQFALDGSKQIWGEVRHHCMFLLGLMEL